MNSKSRFIVFEGIDGSGTTTQIRMLKKILETRNISSVVTCEPTNLTIGKILRQLLSGKFYSQKFFRQQIIAQLFAADRLIHWGEIIEPALKQGKWVLCDRYKYSSFAYQSLFCNQDWVESINGFAPDPDLVLFFDIQSDIALKRVTQRGKPLEIYEKSEIQQKVNNNYKNYFKKDLNFPVFKIDASQTIEEITKKIQFILEEEIKWL